MSETLQTFSDALAALVERAGQSLVRVEGRSRLSASGVIYTADGVIVTAHHVVERNEHLRVGLPDGRSVEATLIGRDPGADLAVLRVSQEALNPATWVNADELRVGHLVLATARPARSVQATLGVVSALGGPWRTGAGSEIDHYLQTDVVMYPGFSGGALLTMDGRIAGVNTSALVRGASVAIPAQTVARSVETILKHGRMLRGYLGVGLQAVPLDAALQASLGQQTGLMVMSVEAGGPAAQAGLLQGDVLVTLDGVAVQRLEELQALLTGERVGKTVPVRFVRAGALQEKNVTIGQK
ncbi:S1C family serine protease [Caldilinea sp.]|uniref:S1C family serine protease n=1 Tax=Caldilinea sp. TaxID=2293560 RepID=UPI0021DD34C8|nr:trypsin-like peptidase domain-containing protein [Caldilinea sp.]GIV69071.1 MAG: serine protease [Caldilinea sp.]